MCRSALGAGVKVISVNRSGKPTNEAAWVDQVEWVASDLADTTNWETVLQPDRGTGAVPSVVSCVGAIGSQSFMRHVCGELTVIAARAAAQHKAPAFAFVSALRGGERPDFPLGLLAEGYFAGKALAEREVARLFPDRHLILRPGVVYAEDSPARRLAAAPLLAAEAVLGLGLVGRVPVLRHSCPAADARDIGNIVTRMVLAEDGDAFPWGTLSPEEFATRAKQWR